MHSVCVFCGSAPGSNPGYVALARQFGTLLAQRGLRLIYGGGRVGLMGALADGVLAAGGEVVGVMPQLLLDKEVGHPGLTHLQVVSTMAERKQAMGDLADMFVTLPGGIGTMDELFEAWTWAQLDLHRKPCGLLNYAGYYDDLVRFLDYAVAEGFQTPRHRAALLVDTELEPLVDRLLQP